MKQRLVGGLIMAAILGTLIYDVIYTEAGQAQHHRLYSFNNG